MIAQTLLRGLVVSTCLTAHVAATSVVDWPVTGGDPGGMRYSPLTDINRTNVATLTVAWTYHHGDYRSGWPDPFKGIGIKLRSKCQCGLEKIHLCP
ncbi:MAG: hypothetical protein HOP18_14995 [Deltaproteobacteria bacterium]|nr:hypothetical protein [Deltaproteobacteria bacterium]